MRAGQKESPAMKPGLDDPNQQEATATTEAEINLK